VFFTLRDRYTTDLFTDNAVDFINSHGDGPFFIEVAYNAALPPYTPPASSAAEGRRIEALRCLSRLAAVAETTTFITGFQSELMVVVLPRQA
jgi:hypothetical protein